ncbi:MAG: hypothetical protein ABIH82_04065 [Candidatus Woesearchaeota archaeon]
MKKVEKVCVENEYILYQLRKLMCGVIANRYNKSKGFQFELLHKNFDNASAIIIENIRRLKR